MKVEIRNLCFSYNNNSRVLNDISFILETGQTLAIVGASGSGKSTLLRILSGIISDSKTLQGSVLLNNINILSNKKFLAEIRYEGKIGFMFQDPTLLPNLSVEENVMLPLELTKWAGNKLEKTKHLLDIVGLRDYRKYLPHELSGGMKTRVALARTFATEPKLLLLDEPFSSLDIVWKIKLYKEVEKLKSEFNTTVVIVTHDIQEALYFSNHIIVTGKGEALNSLIIPDKKLPRYSYEDSIKEFQNEFLQIQDLILVNGEREVVTDYEMLIALNEIEHCVITRSENLPILLNSIQRGAKTKEFHERLVSLWQMGSGEQKIEIAFRLLDYEGIDKNILEEINKYILHDKWEQFVYYLRSKNFYRDDAPLDITINSLRSSENPPVKKWIFACTYCAYLNDTALEKEFLTDIINNHHYMNYPMMSATTDELFLKLKDNF